MSEPLLVRPAALEDLRDAYTWYERQQAGLGRQFMDAIEYSLAQVEANPWQFPVVRKVTRRAIVKRFPYGIFFIPGESVISVLAIMHHARAPRRWQGRE